jgi:hypothetical protein
VLNVPIAVWKKEGSRANVRPDQQIIQSSIFIQIKVKALTTIEKHHMAHKNI